MNILITLDKNYLNPMTVLLISMFAGNPAEFFDVYIISDDLCESDLERMKSLCFGHAKFFLVPVPDSLFAEAPTLRYYSKAMYYRLLAAQLLPQDMDRILYLDPDILILGALRPLYEISMGDALYAAAIHKGLVNLSSPVNRIRLSAYETEGYFNSGVLLMNLPLLRKNASAQQVFDYVKENRQLLILPDQDVLNGLYGRHILPLDERLWNYDARKYREYFIASQGETDMDWVMRHTAILHFCGKNKPWSKAYHGCFSALYKHYMHLCGL